MPSQELGVVLIHELLLSTHTVSVAKGYEAKELGFNYLLSTFVPILRKAGLTDK